MNVGELQDSIAKKAEELGKIQQSIIILEQIWDEVGPYGGKELSDDSIRKLQRYFNFDDSE